MDTRNFNVLLLANVPTPEAAKLLKLSGSYSGGWLVGLLQQVETNKDFSLSYCFFTDKVKQVCFANRGNLSYYALPMYHSIDECQQQLEKLINQVCPDVIHIFGSEYPHSYAMALAAQKQRLITKTILHVQGLVTIYSKHFFEGLPFSWIFRMRPRDFLRNSSMFFLKRTFEKRGVYEDKLLTMLFHIGGRTTWDKACAYHANASAQYHHYNEILRPSFYKSRWSLDSCDRYSIFVSQGSYPIKGLHFILEAMPYILKRFPRAKLIVAGEPYGKPGGSILQGIKRPTYGAYLVYLIRKYGLADSVTFTGPLNEEQMCKQYLKSHVFVSPSTIENSPNSLGEAMLLGMPCVSSFVGGVPDMLKDREEGFLYQADAPYMLAHYVMELFEDDLLASQMGERARKKAMKTHNVDQIYMDLLKMYQDVGNMEE